MTRLWAVVRREYLERVRSKAFLVGTLVGPVLLGALMVGPGALMSRQRGQPLRVAVVDASGRLGGDVEQALRERKADGLPRFDVRPAGAGSLEERRARLRRQVLAGELDGYVLLPEEALERSQAEYHGRNVSAVMDISLIDRVVEERLQARRLLDAGLDPERVQAAQKRLDLKTVKLSERGEREDRGASFLLSMVLLMALYTSVAMWGAALMNGVIEEKSNRVVEVVVSSVPTTTLFAGKLLGVGAVGLTQLSAWAVVAGGFGLVGSRAAALSGLKLPEVPLHLLLFFVLFFLLGFFLYGALYISVGAAVNSQQEAQSLVFPVILPLVVGVMFFPVVLGSPDSSLSVALSLVPFWTPLLMFLRMTVVTPPAWQVALGLALTLLSIAGLTWVAARIYRVGILMYGKRPTFPEILRWVRHS